MAEPELEPMGEVEATGESEAVPEAEDGDQILLISFITVYSLIIVLIVVGNCIVAAVIIRSKLMQKSVVNWYLLSLIIARVMIGLFVVPARITGLFSEEYLKGIICKLCHFVGHGSSVSSVLSIVGISISTYWQLVKGHDLFRTQRGNLLAVVAIWLAGFGYSIHSLVTNDLVVLQVQGVGMWTCTVHPKFYSISRYLVLSDCTIMFIIPFVVTVVCYNGTIKMLTSRLESGGKVGVSPAHVEALTKIRMIVILMSLFTICSLAPVMCKMYLSWDGPPFTNISTITTGLYMFSYSNAWYNIIVFAIFRKDIRNGFIDMCCKPKPMIAPKTESESKEGIVNGVDSEGCFATAQPGCAPKF